MQLSLPESVTKRGYQSVSVFHLGPHCVWLLVFGGRIPQKIVAYTAIIELGKYCIFRMLCQLSHSMYVHVCKDVFLYFQSREEMANGVWERYWKDQH